MTISRLGIAGLVSAAWLGAQQKAAAPVSCPAVISDKQSIQRSFERPLILNVDRRGREYYLAPDTERKTGSLVVQTWNLDGYREMRLALRCHYRDTMALFAIELPATVKVCTFRFQAAGGTVSGRPEFSCR